MGDITVRLARREDCDLLAAGNAAMALETEGRRLDPATVAAGTRAVVENPDLGFYLVAEEDGRYVGQLMVTYEWSDWRNGRFWWIQSVYTSPARRRRGVFHTLYRWLAQEARARAGVCGLRLYVDQGNDTARRTYAALGMSRCHYDMFEVDFVLGVAAAAGEKII